MEEETKTVLITGANGFVGRGIISYSSNLSKLKVCVSMRNNLNIFPPSVKVFSNYDVSASTDWTSALSKVDCVIHCAARAHIMNDSSVDPLTKFRQTNVEGTLNLVRQASSSGVKRFIFLSSLKVNGESTEPGKPFNADDRPNPSDPYGISKMEAEEGLREIASNSDMEFVIIRPPLVYGPGVKANFLSMIHWLNRGFPLPLGAIHNKRSFVALDNLVNLIVHCISHPAAANQTFLVSDDEDLSTTDLLKRIGNALGKPTLLIPVPTFLLRTAAALIRKSDIAQRLLGSLQADISKTKKVLEWTPPIRIEEALKKTVDFYSAHSSGCTTKRITPR